MLQAPEKKTPVNKETDENENMRKYLGCKMKEH